MPRQVEDESAPRRNVQETGSRLQEFESPAQRPARVRSSQSPLPATTQLGRGGSGEDFLMSVSCPSPSEDIAARLIRDLWDSLSTERKFGNSAHNDTAGSLPTEARVSFHIFRKYMEAMHASMKSKDDRIWRLQQQLEESRAEAQILRLAPRRQASADDYDIYQARQIASDREQLHAKDRMLQLYDVREEDSQRMVDQLNETLRYLTQRVDAVLVHQGQHLSVGVRQELQRIVETGTISSHEDASHEVSRLRRGCEFASASGLVSTATMAEDEIICQRKSLDEMSAEIESLQRQNQALQRQLEDDRARRHFEVQDGIQQAIAAMDNRVDKEKVDLLQRLHALEAHTDKIMSRENDIMLRHTAALQAKENDLDTANSEISSLKNSLVVQQKQNTVLLNELKKQEEDADMRMLEVRKECQLNVQRKQDRIKQLLADLDESRQAYLKVVSELSERVMISEIVATPDPVEEQIMQQSRELEELERIREESNSAMCNARKAHDYFAAIVRSRLRQEESVAKTGQS
jgi:hypothetical protein